MAERLAKVIKLLDEQRRTGILVEEVAAELGTSKRTAYRYMNALEAVYLISREPDGRWVPLTRLGARFGSRAGSCPE